jgi:hypothetical protein
LPRRESRAPRQRPVAGGLLIAALCGTPQIAAFADGRPDVSQDIVTDRASVTNSSVVPTGSLQLENGINLTEHPGQGALDGPNTRIRLGIFQPSFLSDRQVGAHADVFAEYISDYQTRRRTKSSISAARIA